MIYNRYFLALFTAHQAISCCQAASRLRGLRVQNYQNNNGRHLNADSNNQNNDFDQLVDLLNSYYGESSCEIHVSGGYAMTPVTTVDECQYPGGYTILTANGTSSDVSGGPYPSKLEVCEYGANMATTCQHVVLTGNTEMDMTKAEDLIVNDEVMTDYQMLVQFLNSTYAGSCQTSVIGSPYPGTPTTQVVCTQPGGQATLTAKGTTKPIPAELEVCFYGAYMQETCSSIDLTGNKEDDIPAARELVLD
jgi:hypothetical protein